MAKKFEDLTEEEFDQLNSIGLLQSIYPEAPKKWKQPTKEDKGSKFYNDKKEMLLTFVPDCLSNLLYYYRKECEEISVDEVDYLFKNNLISRAELLNAFSKSIDNCFNQL